MNYTNLLQEFKKLQIKEPPETTFLEIVDKSHLENVWSRILAFYFNPHKGHGLSKLLINSLFEAIGQTFIPYDLPSFQVGLEHQTQNGRIDIIIQTNSFVIGIENKVNAQLYNDLYDYSQTIESLAKGKKVIKIILSKFNVKIEEGSGFKNLTYENFIRIIKKNLGHYYSNANYKYVIFFLDFIDNIEKNLNLVYMINDQNVMTFFMNRQKEILELLDKNKQINKELYSNLNKLYSSILTDNVLKLKFQEIMSNDAFILDSPFIYAEDDTTFLLIHIKLKDLLYDKMQYIIQCSLYYKEYKWHFESRVGDKYSLIFGNGLEEEHLYFNDLAPWTEIELINEKVTGQILSCAKLVKHHEAEILRM